MMQDSIGENVTEPQIDRIKIYIVEEQDILREAYKAALPLAPSIEVTAISGDTDTNAIISVLSVIKADVLLMGVKAFRPDTVDRISTIRERYPDLGIILLSGSFDVQAMIQLKEFARSNPAGWAFLSRDSIDTTVKMTRLIQSISSGHVIMDTVVMEAMIETDDPGTAFLKQLTGRELQVLNWMVKGYRNDTIAQVLCVDPQLIEQHLNSIYSKMKLAVTSISPRVSAALLYLKAIGQLFDDRSV